MPRGYHVVIEVAGHQFVRGGIDTLTFAREVYEAVCAEPVEAAWLVEGSPTNPGREIESFVHAVIRMGRPKITTESIVQVRMTTGVVGPTKYRVESIDIEKGCALIQEIRYDGERAPAVPVTFDIDRLVIAETKTTA